jgi:hypothetical protein
MTPNMALNRSADTMRLYFQLSVPRPVSYTLNWLATVSEVLP